MKRPSIQRRLIFGTSLFTALVLTICIVMMFFTMRGALYDQVDADLQTLSSVIMDEVEFEHGMIEHEWIDHLKKNPERVKRDFIQVWSPDNSPPLKSPAMKDLDLPMFHGPDGKPAFRTVTLADGTKLRAVGWTFHARKSKKKQEFVMVLAHATPEVERVMHLLQVWLPVGLILIILFTTIITRQLIRSSLVPIASLEDDIKKTDAESTKLKRITISEDLPSELLNLAQHYNNLLERIGRARTRERNFSAHAAHEMRTPLAGIHAILQQALKQKRTPESYEERIVESLEITHRMKKLMDRLMHFSQLQSGTVPLHCDPFKLKPLIMQELDGFESLRRENHLTLTTHLQDIMVQGDQELVTVIIKNLIQNALHYADPETTVHLETKSDEYSHTFTISNQASGIQANEVREFFDAFYRNDSSRSAESGHFGLGLALSREIALSLKLNLDAKLDDSNTIHFILTFTAEDSSSR